MKRLAKYAVRLFVLTTIILVLAAGHTIVKMQTSQAECQNFLRAEHAELQHRQVERNHAAADRQQIQPFVTDQLQAEHSYPAEETSIASELTETASSKLLLVSATVGSSSGARAPIKNGESNTPEVYKTGQRIDNGYTEKTEENSVVVVRRGRKYELKLAADRPEAATAQTTSDKNWLLTAEQVHSQPPASNTALTITRSPVPQASLGFLEMVLQATKLQPCKMDDEVQGLTIAGLENVPVKGRTDLRNGDIIHSINGHQLISKQQAWQVLNKARSEDTLDIEVLFDD